ncbi:MAG: hypothetical protein Q9160_008968 [Pyrenula sp. 1 TL-2023]
MGPSTHGRQQGQHPQLEKAEPIMALTRLANELLDDIVECTLPQGFESIALTCKKIYALCIPFIKRHNEPRSRFRDIACYVDSRDCLVATSDLLTLIAMEPIIARYIRTANLQYDSIGLIRALVRQPPKSVPSIDDGGAVVDLFANSTYLRQAGLDWKECYAIFEENVRKRRYSQHGAALLLTLLPNVEMLITPKHWKPNATTNKLLAVLVDDAKQSRLPLSNSSLSAVTRLESPVSIAAGDRCDLSWVSPLLVLPRLRSFHGLSCFSSGDGLGSLAFSNSYYNAETLQAIHLIRCCIDGAGIANLLKHTPRLQTLRYRHCTKNNYPYQDWDICKFVNAVAREAGSHLVEFSVDIRELRGSILPGKASMRGCQQLKKLEYPLELVTCNITSASVGTHIVASLKRFLDELTNPFVSDLIPASVAQLSLISKGTDHHKQALNALFCRFSSVRKCQLPAMHEIYIGCLQSSDQAYKQQCNRIVKEAGDEGVVVRLDSFENAQVFYWDGES